MAWSISPGGTFEDLGVTGCRRTMQSGGRSTCEVTIAKDLSTAADYAEDDVVTVTGPDGTFFTGVVDRPARGADGANQEHTVTLTTKWKWLEEIPYTQPFASGSGSTAIRKSSVVLGLDDSGDRQTTAQIISGILSFANTQSAGITVGTILDGVTLTPPIMQLSDVTCAEAIRSVMRWHPDAVLWFSPDGELNITRPEDMDAVSRAVGGSANTARCELAPRQSMELRGVVIHYEVTTTVDGVDYLDIVDDIAGASTGRRVVHFTIPLRGANIVTQAQEIEARDIPDELSELAAWIPLHFPEIADANPEAGDLEILSFTHTVAEDEKVGPGTVMEVYPRELIKGNIQPWMTGVSAAPVTITMNVKFTGDPMVKTDLAALFPNADRTQKFYANMMGTDAEDQTYRTSGGSGGETVPEGLAAAYFAAFQDPPPEGEYTSLGADPDADVYPGLALTLSGSATVSSAPVQSATTDVFSGATTVKFGPMNASLTPGSFLELLRAGQRQCPLVNPSGSIRTDASAGASGNTIQGATGGRMKSSSRQVKIDGGITPWACAKVDDLKLRIYPTLIMDGAGNTVWPEYSGVTATPGSNFELTFSASAGEGWVYLLCDVDDSDDENGIIESAELLVSASPPTFYENIGLQVAIPVCYLNVGPTTFSFEAVRTFLFILRRYGPPGSGQWDVQPAG